MADTSGTSRTAPDIGEHKPGPDKECQLVEPMGTCDDADVNVSILFFCISLMFRSFKTPFMCY